jgi:hypothetical protein
MRQAVLLSFIFIATGLYAQMLPIVQMPQPSTLNVPQIPGLNQGQPNRPQVNPFNTIDHDAINQRNQQIINEALENQRQIASRNSPQIDLEMLATTGFPSLSSMEGTSNYYQSFTEINDMLQGKQPLSLGRAVFLVENSYYGNTLKYTDFQTALNDKIWLCNQKIKEDKLDANNDLVKNMMLFRLISDTLKIKPTGTEKAITNYPIKYDLDDYKSETNYDSHFVTKLMKSGKGQCYSMPLYYLVLAEQIGASASLSFSPRHSFIKIQDEKGAWYNLELTCNAILSDAHYMNNSYIKAEAIRNRIYLEPLNKKDVVAGMLLELAMGYYEKYGLDDFYLKCVDTSLAFSKKDINAYIMKAVYEERLTLTLARLLEAPKPEIMKEKSPRAYSHYEKMQALYKQIDGMGYEELPASIYAKWLDYLNTQKEKSRKDNSVRINGLR